MDSRCKLVCFFIWLHYLIPKSWSLFPVCDSILRLRPALCSVWWRCYCLRLALCLRMSCGIGWIHQDMKWCPGTSMLSSMKCGWFCWQSCCFQSCVCYLLMRVFSALVNLEGWDVSGQSELGDAISCGIHRWESGCKGLQTDPLSNLPCQLSDGCKCEKDETLSPLLTQHKHRSHRNFHIISYRSVWEISMSPHFLVMDSEWDTATSAMFATISCHDCGFAALCDLFAFLPTSCIGEWLPKAGASLSMTLPVGHGNFKIRDCSRKSLITGGDPAASARKCMEAQSVWEFWWFRGPWLEHV